MGALHSADSFVFFFEVPRFFSLVFTMSHSNARGVIAEQYSELQAIHVLDAAREAYGLPPASPESTIRAIYQAAEIALLNLADLVSRSAHDLDRRQFGRAVVKLSWARGFHRVMLELSLLPQQLALIGDADGGGVLRIDDSPALRTYLNSLTTFDSNLARITDGSELDLDRLLASESLDSNELRLLHLTRVCNHETMIWERNLAEVYVPVQVPSYETFVVARGMYDAVYDRKLDGDTFFTQFRGLHQIPEILCTEINDRIERAIMALRDNHPKRAYEHLRCANILSVGVLAALPAMTDNLATADYHEIRENLGLTSGSHSVNLHYHLFRDLYQQLWDAIATSMLGSNSNVASVVAIEAAIREANRNASHDDSAFMANLLLNECLRLRVFVQTWRDEHLLLPRGNLGGNRTKSLTGSGDAVKAVRAMRDIARAKDPMQPLTSARELMDHRATDPPKLLTEYLEAPESFDSRMADTTGNITQRRFQQVQERLGVFANECPFSPPPRRIVPSSDER